MKRSVLMVAAALAVAAAALAAPPAQAGVDNPRILLGKVGAACDLSSGAGQTSVTGNPGDSFTIYDLGCGDIHVTFSGSAVSGPTSIPNNGKGVYTLSSTVGTGAMLIRGANTQIPFLIDVYVTNVPVTTPIAKLVPPPHDVLQQVGVPKSGNCDDVAHDAGHVDGFPYGGWGRSWARWINEGKGGPVCTRELFWNGSTMQWQVLGT